MAIRRLNFTARKRLGHADVRISMYPGVGKPATFDAELNLEGYKLPEDALVFVEAYRQTAWMRFDFGTIGAIHAPENRTLAEFDVPEAILFRVRITSGAGEKGLLVAEADGIRSKETDEAEEKRVPLLPVKPDGNLGSRVFKVDFTDRPILLVNRKVGDWRAVVRQPAFVALVYPSVFHGILTRILKVEEHDDTEDGDDWRAQWLRFALLLGGIREVPDVQNDPDEDVDDWIEEAVSAFCHRVRTLKHFQSFWSGSQD